MKIEIKLSREDVFALCEAKVRSMIGDTPKKKLVCHEYYGSVTVETEDDRPEEPAIPAISPTATETAKQPEDL